MTTIIKDGKHLTVGKDFVGAVTGQTVSFGRIELNNKSIFTWAATVPIVAAERALRKAAKEDGFRITLFVSQAAEKQKP